MKKHDAAPRAEHYKQAIAAILEASLSHTAPGAYLGDTGPAIVELGKRDMRQVRAAALEIVARHAPDGVEGQRQDDLSVIYLNIHILQEIQNALVCENALLNVRKHVELGDKVRIPICEENYYGSPRGYAAGMLDTARTIVTACLPKATVEKIFDDTPAAHPARRTFGNVNRKVSLEMSLEDAKELTAALQQQRGLGKALLHK